MRFLSGCSHPSFALPWRTLLAHLLALHLPHLGSAQLTVVAPSLRVTAIAGQDVVLRCHLSPCKDAWSSDIRWIQQQSSALVHHYQNGEDLEQMEEYKGRTELLRNGLSDGNLDLRITAVSSADSGSYSCVVQDGDGYAEAVVDLEVSDPFSEIIHPWKVALAVVITLLVGSFVINVFLYRKQAEQSVKLKRKDTELVNQAQTMEKKDAELAEQAETLKRKDTELVNQAQTMERKDAELAEQAETLKKQAAKLDLSAAVLKKQAAKLVKRTKALAEKSEAVVKQNSQLRTDCDEIDSSAADLKILTTKLDLRCEKMELRDADLKKLAERLVERTDALVERSEAVEKQNSRLKKDCEEMDSNAADLKKLAIKLDSSAAQLKEQVGKLAEALEKPSEELD